MARTMRGPTLLLLLLLGMMLSCCTMATAQDTTADSCYQFTWIIEKNSTDCDELQESGVPCFEPFVVTGTGDGDMSNQFPPNITDLDETCQRMNCPSYTCDKNDNQCLTWTETDIKGKPQYISRFCGSMADVTKIEDPNAPSPPAITDECFVNLNGTVTVEACVCDRNKCNAGTRAGSLNLQMALLSLVAAVFVSKWAEWN